MKRHSTKRKTGRQIGTSKCLSCCVVCWMNTLTTEFEAMGGLLAPPPPPTKIFATEMIKMASMKFLDFNKLQTCKLRAGLLVNISAHSNSKCYRTPLQGQQQLNKIFIEFHTSPTF